MKTKANSEFNIKDLGDHVEMTTVLFTGLIEGISYLAKEGYDIIIDSCVVRGTMYIIPAYKPKKESEIGENVQESFEEVSLDDLTKKDELLEYAKENGYEIPEDLKLPSQIKKYLKEVGED